MYPITKSEGTLHLQSSNATGRVLPHYPAGASLLQTQAVRGAIVVAFRWCSWTNSSCSPGRSGTARPTACECSQFRHSADLAKQTDTLTSLIDYSLTHNNHSTVLLVMVWHSDSVMVSINLVTLHRAQLVKGWVRVTVCGFELCSLHLLDHPGQLSLGHPCIGKAKWVLAVVSARAEMASSA